MLLTLADVVVLADVYAARETDTLGIHCEDLADDIRRKGTESYYFPSFDAIENFLLEDMYRQRSDPYHGSRRHLSGGRASAGQTLK